MRESGGRSFLFAAVCCGVLMLILTHKHTHSHAHAHKKNCCNWRRKVPYSERLVRITSSTVHTQLREDVESAMQACENGDRQGEDAQQLALRLGQNWGYPDVRVRTALGGGEGQSCLRNLRHTFLTVRSAGACLCIRAGEGRGVGAR